MDGTLIVINLSGAVALLLWGVHMVETGVQRALGPNLQRWLSHALDHRLKAFAAGIGITALLQSSTATGLMLASFASNGLVKLVPGLAVMLGANVGTTLIAQVLAFDIARITPLFVLAGVILFRRGTQPRTRDLGRVAIGLGLMLTGLAQLLHVIVLETGMPTLRLVLDSITSDYVVAIGLAATLTWAAHSSVAIVLMIMSFAAKGALPLDIALALVLGANLGSALNPVLAGVRGHDMAGQRVAIGNLLIRGFGCIAALPLLHPITLALSSLQPDLPRVVANFHTILNLVLAIVFLPLLVPLSTMLVRLLPEQFSQRDPGEPLYLDANALAAPPLAIGNASREALRMADVLAEMIESAREAIAHGDQARLSTMRRMDDILDRLNSSIKAYLVRLDPDALSETDERRVTALIAFITNIEHAGDILGGNLMNLAGKRLKRGLVFSEDGIAEINTLLDRLAGNLRTAVAVFMTDDIRSARLLTDEKAVFRDLEARATAAHFRRLRSMPATAAEAAALFPDLVRDLKRINDHLVAGAAYPVLENQGALMTSRLRDSLGKEV